MLDQLTEALRAHVAKLAAAPRPPGTPAHEQAAAYIREHLGKAGFTPREVVYREAGLVCRSVHTDPEPADEGLPLVIIAAHYDSIDDSPGADDNASAVGALIELARLLRPRLQAGGPWRARLQLAAYDLEEYGLIGSFLHSRELRQAGRAVRGMVSLEMLGYTDGRPGSQGLPPHLSHLYPDVGNFIGVVGNDASLDLLGLVVKALKRVPGLPVECLAVPGNGELLRETRLSDHSPFWDHGFPALMITDTSFFRNPHYHQASDTPDTLDYPFLAKVTTGVCEATVELLSHASLSGSG
jgi:Zn-dependent M28 family amino/carboxypeptidase